MIENLISIEIKIIDDRDRERYIESALMRGKAQGLWAATISSLFCIPILSFFYFFFFFSFTSAISGHMGTPNVIGRERAERKSSAYNRLDEI